MLGAQKTAVPVKELILKNLVAALLRQDETSSTTHCGQVHNLSTGLSINLPPCTKFASTGVRHATPQLADLIISSC